LNAYNDEKDDDIDRINDDAFENSLDDVDGNLIVVFPLDR